MKIFITGVDGLIGSHLSRTLSRTNNVQPFTHRQLDITKKSDVRTVVGRERPDLIVNCAVVGVGACEENPSRAQEVNVRGPENLAVAANEVGADIIHFSTNYVFDGKREQEYYTIDDPALPINVYGRTKLEGEQAVNSKCENSFIIRTSWVFGLGKNNFYADVHRRLEQGDEIEVDDDIFANTTYVKDLVDRVDLILEWRKFGTYHVVNSGVCSKFTFAQAAAEYVGVDPHKYLRRIDRETIVPRPVNTPMRCLMSEKFGFSEMRGWREALGEYIRT